MAQEIPLNLRDMIDASIQRGATCLDYGDSPLDVREDMIHFGAEKELIVVASMLLHRYRQTDNLP